MINICSVSYTMSYFLFLLRKRTAIKFSTISLNMWTIVFSCAVHWSLSSNRLPQLSSFSAEGAWCRRKWGWFPWRWGFWSGHTKEEASKQRQGEWWAWLIKVCGWCEGKKASESKKKLTPKRIDTRVRNKTWKRNTWLMVCAESEKR